MCEREPVYLYNEGEQLETDVQEEQWMLQRRRWELQDGQVNGAGGAEVEEDLACIQNRNCSMYLLGMYFIEMGCVQEPTTGYLTLVPQLRHSCDKALTVLCVGVLS